MPDNENHSTPCRASHSAARSSPHISPMHSSNQAKLRNAIQSSRNARRAAPQNSSIQSPSSRQMSRKSSGRWET